MATYTGFDGVLKIADGDTSGITSLTAIGNLRNFSIEQTQDTIETTTMSSGGNRTYAGRDTGISTFASTSNEIFCYLFI